MTVRNIQSNELIVEWQDVNLPHYEYELLPESIAYRQKLSVT